MLFTFGAPRADGQVSVAAIDGRASTRAWLAGGVGPDTRDGFAAEWEGWIAHGPLALGYQVSTTQEFHGDRGRSEALLGGIAVSVDRFSLILQGGLATHRRCTGNQGWCRTTTTVSGIPAFGGTVHVLFGPYLGLHTTYYRIVSRDVGYSALAVGMVVGKLR